MKTYRTTIFCKQPTCPSSETLLSYGTASLAIEMKATVATHLAACDFCDAELRLLTNHAPAADESYQLTAMPAHLRYLAESLLAGSLLRMESFSEITCDKERLTLIQ